MFINNKCNTFFGLNLTLVYTFPMCMAWRFHFSIRNYDFKCFCWVKKAVSGWMPCLAGRWPWSWYIGSSPGRQRSPLLATLRRMWGEAIPGSAYKQGIEPAFKQPVIILRESFRAISTCPVYFWNGPTKNIKFSCRKANRQCGCSYGSCVRRQSSPPLLKVLCARLLKLIIAFRDIFVLRLYFLGNKLHRFLTG